MVIRFYMVLCIVLYCMKIHMICHFIIRKRIQTLVHGITSVSMEVSNWTDRDQRIYSLSRQKYDVVDTCCVSAITRDYGISYDTLYDSRWA